MSAQRVDEPKRQRVDEPKRRRADEPKRQREQWTWRDGVVIVSVIALGTVVAGVTHDEETPSIPGCESVESPPPSLRFTIGSAGEASYDDPDYPWFDGPKATAMSASVRDSLPADVELVFAGQRNSLVFQPIQNFRDTDFPEGADPEKFSGSTSAYGQLTRDGLTTDMTVQVRMWTEPVPACMEGYVDQRVRLEDGTILDVADFVTEDGSRAEGERGVVAYRPDETQVVLSLDTSSDTEPLLTIDELTAIATDPKLGVSVQVSPSTPAPMKPCYGDMVNGGPRATREIVDRLNHTLDARWRELALTGVTVDRPLGSLVPGEIGGGACARIAATTVDGTADIEISIGTAVPEPEESIEFPATSTVVRNADPYANGALSVRLTHPSGESVVVRLFPSATVFPPSVPPSSVPPSSVPLPAIPLTVEQLEFIATAPGLLISP